MFSLLLVCDLASEDGLIADLHDAGTVGIAEEPGGLRAFFDGGLPELLRRFAAYTPMVRQEEAADWEQIVRDSFPPLTIGRRWFLVPPWRTDPTPPGRMRLEINPGMACGTGWHPCTQLCLEALEGAVKAGDTVLDVGSGSGILSQAAVMLEASRVCACDIDVDALLIARERVHVPMFAGSINAVRPAMADVVVANISSDTANELAAEFARVLVPGGTLIVSGFETGDLPEGFESCRVLARDGWACIVC